MYGFPSFVTGLKAVVRARRMKLRRWAKDLVTCKPVSYLRSFVRDVRKGLAERRGERWRMFRHHRRSTRFGCVKAWCVYRRLHGSSPTRL